MRFIALAAALISVPALAHEELAASSVQDRHLTCLTQAIYYEARGQSRAGQIAVGQVVLNRTRDRRFPSDICGVVYQRRNNQCQFSWACHRRTHPVNTAEWSEARNNATIVMTNIPDITGGALYFQTVQSNNLHGVRRTVRIDNHIFYRG